MVTGVVSAKGGYPSMVHMTGPSGVSSITTADADDGLGIKFLSDISVVSSVKIHVSEDRS